MKKNWKIALAAACAAVAITAVYSVAAGGQNDPLVTLSYLKNIFTPQIEAMVDKAVEDSAANTKTEVEQAMQEWDIKIQGSIGSSGGGSGSGSSFVVTSVKAGGTMAFSGGCEIVVTSGAPVTSVALVDQTDGTTLAAGSDLKANHLYLAAQDGRLSVAAGGMQTGTVNGVALNLRAGAGSSYDVLSVLSSGTVVTVLEQSGGWLKVSAQSQIGYVSAAYILLDPLIEAVPAELMVRGTYSVE